jgi:hypothetical protein
LQTSFATEDAVKVMHFHENVRKAGWNAALIETGVKSGWYAEWCAVLDIASAALVVFSDTYREKFTRGPLAKEAEALLARVERDPDFRLYVCEPSDAEQGPSIIRAWLQDRAASKNVKAWRDFVEQSGVSLVRGTGSGVVDTPPSDIFNTRPAVPGASLGAPRVEGGEEVAPIEASADGDDGSRPIAGGGGATAAVSASTGALPALAPLLPVVDASNASEVEAGAEGGVPVVRRQMSAPASVGQGPILKHE